MEIKGEQVLDDFILTECRNAKEIERQVLEKILSENRDTEYGEKYGFADIGTADEYRKRLPLTEYADYEKSVDRMIAGEKNVLTAYDVVGYCRSSGTSSTGRKNIPITQVQLEQYGNSADAYVDRLLKEQGGKRLQIATFRTTPESEELSLLYTEVYYRNKTRAGRMDMEEYVGGREFVFNREKGDWLFIKAYAALLEEDIVLIEGIYLYELLHFFTYMEENIDRLLASIRERSFPEDIEIPENVRKVLLSLPVSEKRIRKIEKECTGDFEGIAKRLWPKLKLVAGISSQEYFAENAMLRRYTEEIPEYYYIYCASECYVGNPVALDDFRYVMVPDKAFFEFLPYDEEDRIKDTCLPHELKQGALYEVVVTNFGGLYRYRMGDLVRILDYIGESPVLEFAGRRNLSLNIAGEKVNLSQIEYAMLRLSMKGIDVSMYCFASYVKKVPGYYLAAIALNDPAANGHTEQEVAEWLDEALMQYNPDYEDLRRLKEIAPLRVRLFDAEEYMAFMKENGLSGGHHKPKHIAPNGFLGADAWK